MSKNKFEIGSIKKEVGDSTFKGGHNDLRKTNYDVNIKDGKLDLNTHKEVITESKELLNEGRAYYDEHTGLLYLRADRSGGDVPFTKEAVEQLRKFFDSTPKLAKQFFVYPLITIRDNVNGGEVRLDKQEFDELFSLYKKMGKKVASDKDFR
jgi:hypothetical protein